MKVSGASAERFFKSPDPAIWCALIFCEDDGVAADAGQALFKAWSGKQPAERLVLTEDDIAKSPAHFFDTLEARSLLGDMRILTVRLSNEKLSKHFVSAIEAADATPGRYDTRLILISSGLKKTSKLRKIAESATSTMAAQLFADTEEDIEKRVRAALEQDGVDIDPEALSLFLDGLPRDRRLVRGEVNKLALYGVGLERPLNTADISAISAAGQEAAQSALVSFAMQGQSGAALTELEHLETVGTSSITLLRAFQREAERLLSAHNQGVSDANGAMRLRPPVWRDQWPAFKASLRSWTPAMLVRLLARIHQCEADAKTAGAMAGPATRHLVTDIIRLAAAKAGR